MKSSIRSKLFLLVYGLFLAFIAGLILLNNSFLENYYIKNRKASLVEAFYVIENYDMEDDDFEYNIEVIENDYNLNVQVLRQVTEFDPGYVWSGFEDPPDIFERVFGLNHNISNGIITRIIYDFNQQTVEDNSDYAEEVSTLSNEGYTAYLMDIQSEFNLDTQNTNMIGLVVTGIDGNDDIYYLLTITFQSIEDSIRIFNSFTILVGFFFMIISFVTMYFISYSFTNPILQINKIAEEITNLNFTNRLNIKSDDELGDLGNSINQMSEQLEGNIKELQKTNDRLAKEILHKNDVDEMRRDFIASASHELKTPLSMILGYTEALRLSNLDLESRDEYISIILDETNKMNKLVQDLLRLSQTESKTIEINLKDLKIKDLIDDTINLFSLKFKELDINLEVASVDRLVNSDYNQLQTVLTNFISNAINYIDESKIVKINAVLKENNIVRVSVYNSGPNISEDEINHIWDSFYKIDKARTRSYGGQGLGLSICKTTLEMLGYDYGVTNKENGVEFYFEIYLV
ncbi:MAG: HAMP domain-containing histidine kinase [Tenericutes bacterium]|nr:HAMP domain-containing histidine kinase [Mycoplasmatota bacterium]